MIQTTFLNDVKCKFCGKELRQKEMLFDLEDKKFTIKGQIERCDCDKSKEYWKRIDFEKEKKKKDRRYDR